MSKPVFVYVTYIASTPEKVFRALTDTDATAKFWFGNAVTSDWKVGSPVAFHRDGKLIISGKVLEHDAPRRLSYTFTAEHEPHNGKEGPSRVVMDLEQQRDQVKLTIAHDGFAPDSKVFSGISNGWPLVLSNLKSYLETGTTPLHAPWYEEQADRDSEKIAS
ncbi:MAG TPA: SRPBCC family protein [Candidatus Binatia bacterium]|jgi:uncharacterized protein YndB with AHSA1/START domain